MVDPHKILGVPKDATLGQIKAAYRQKLFKYHPDQGGDAWAFQQVEMAYRQLTETDERPNPAVEDRHASQPTNDFAAGPQAQAATSPEPAVISPAAMLIAGGIVGALVGAVVGALVGINPMIAALIGSVPGIVAGKFSSPTLG